MGIKRRKQRSTRRRRKRRKIHRRRRSRAIAASTAPPLWTIAVEWDDKAIWYTPNSKDDNNTKIGVNATVADLLKAALIGPNRLSIPLAINGTLDMYYLEGEINPGTAIRLPNNTSIQIYLRNGGIPLLQLRHEISTGTRTHPIDLTTDSPDHVAARSRTLRHRRRRRKKRKKTLTKLRRRKRRKTY